MIDSMASTDHKADTRAKGSVLPTPAPAPAPKHRPTKPLPSNRVAFDKQLTLLRGYAAASGPDRTPVDLATLAETVGMASTTVSLMNGFFGDVGFIEKVAGGYVPVPEVVSFAQVHNWDPDKAGPELAPVVGSTWFAAALIPKLKINPFQEDAALAALAKEAHADVDYRPKVRILLEYLRTAGLISIDGTLVSARHGQPPAPEQAPKPTVRDRPSSHEQDGQPSPVRAPSTQASEPLPLLIRGLLEQLPRDGVWTRPQARSWLQMAAMAFEVVYDLGAGNEPLWPPAGTSTQGARQTGD